MQKFTLYIRRGPRTAPGFSVERLHTLSGSVAKLACFSDRAAALRFAAQVSQKTGWHFPTAQIVSLRGANA